MFDTDKWQEIIDTLRKNKLRTALTAAGVFWGILMLIVMLGFGAGFENGVKKNIAGFAANSVFIWGQRTSMPFEGLQPGRRVRFTTEDIPMLKDLEGLEYLAPRIRLGGWRGGNNVARGQEVGSFGVMGDYPQLAKIQGMDFRAGRFVNQLDIKDRRKVAVIGTRVHEVLYEDDEDPIGTYIRIQGVYFQVVGLFKAKQSGDHGDRQDQTIFVPFTTFRQAFNTGDRVGFFALSAHADYPGEKLEAEAASLLKDRHRINPNDSQALGSFNAAEEFGKMTDIFSGINMFMWIVGIMTLMAGVLGVSNIMLIVVKERTKEIGIRKALGATPASVVGLVIQESIALTALAGYAGVVVGVAGIELAASLWPEGGLVNGAFTEPTVSLGVAVIATIVLIVSGAIAGIIPARHAAAIRPVVALRAE